MKTLLFVSVTDFSSSKLTGAQRRLFELINNLSRDNNVVFIGIENYFLNVNNVTFIKLEQAKKMHLPSHIFDIFRTVKTLKRHRKDLFYDYAISFGLEDGISYKIAGFRKVITLFRDDRINYLKAINATKFKILYYSFLEKIVVNSSDKIIVQCKNDALNLISRNKIKNKKKVFIQVNNVNASWMKNEIQKKTSNDDIVRILFVGGFNDNRKGHQIFLPAINMLIEQNYKIVVYVAGSGKDLDVYRQKFQNENIKFLGHITNFDELYSKCDFSVVPSLIDSCPNTILEALNNGVAVYGSSTGGIPDLLSNDEYMFSPDIESIYIFLKKIIDEKRYIIDSVEQVKIKERLTFDWAMKVLSIILEGE